MQHFNDDKKGEGVFVFPGPGAEQHSFNCVLQTNNQ